MTGRRKYYMHEVAAEEVQIPIIVRRAPEDVWGKNVYLIDVDGRTGANYNADTNILTLEGDIFPPLERPNITYPALVKRVVGLIQRHFGRKPRSYTGAPYWSDT